MVSETERAEWETSMAQRASARRGRVSGVLGSGWCWGEEVGSETEIGRRGYYRMGVQGVWGGSYNRCQSVDSQLRIRSGKLASQPASPGASASRWP